MIKIVILYDSKVDYYIYLVRLIRMLHILKESLCKIKHVRMSQRIKLLLLP